MMYAIGPLVTQDGIKRAEEQENVGQCCDSRGRHLAGAIVLHVTSAARET